MADKNASWLANPATAVVQNAGNIVATAMHNKTVKELAKQQNQWNLEQWNRQNAYDSPAAQMQRYVEAGLNPNLIYGSANGNGTPSAPAVSGYENLVTPQVDFSPMLYASQIKLNNANADKALGSLDNETKLTDAKVKDLLGETKYKESVIENLVANTHLIRETATRTQAEIQKIGSEIVNLDYQNQRAFWEAYYSEEEFKTRVDFLKTQLDMEQTKADNLQREIDAAIEELISRAASNRASASASYANTKVSASLVNYYNALGDKAAADEALVNLQKSLLEEYGDDIEVGKIVESISSGPKSKQADKIIKRHKRVGNSSAKDKSDFGYRWLSF